MAAIDRALSSASRLSVAIERVGGPEVVTAALKPQVAANGRPLNWAATCAVAAEGLAADDPVFHAWVRLAATPVRDVRSQVRRLEQERGGRPGETDGERLAGSRPGGDPGRWPRRDNQSSRQEDVSHAQGGLMRKS
ncbi:MAG: hypothetical protein QOJ63_2226, partial [Solirubrobacteraceae bacterium]|nr:hypothetical protein [Solirubrobacteraceae bacterium]